MTNHKQKLELTWIGKDKHPSLEPRILLEDPELSYHASHRISDTDVFDNRLIFGDNLLALKSLEQEYTGAIQCIYIDPPFNTGSAFEFYDDGLEHSVWLTMMRDRLELLRKLLSPTGIIFVHIDNNEFAYLKVLMDEIFYRSNFVQMISVKRASPAGFKVINPGPLTVTDYILIYAKNKECMNYNALRIPVEYDENYNLYIDNPQSPPENWVINKLTDLLYQRLEITNWRDARKKWGSQWKTVRNSLLGDLAIELKEQVVSVRDPHKPSKRIQEAMVLSKKINDKVIVLERDNNDPVYIYNGGSLAFYRDKLIDVNGVFTPTELLTDFWSDINFAGIANEGSVQFKNGKKPEMLLQRVIEMSTQPNDLILDSFAGSGTTGAVAHKMGRRWIMVELGEHCHTHIIPRLKRLIDGEDTSGITPTVNWKGGGGFRYYKLAPSLLENDRWGNWVINKQYNAGMLAEAVCKLEGFTYGPSEEHYWMHGYSSEQDFIYVTTQTLTHDQLLALSEEVGQQRTLLVLCSAYRATNGEAYPNLTIKKIPQAILLRCEYGHDDYSLQVANLPAMPPATQSEEDDQEGPRQLGLNLGGESSCID